MFSRNNKNEEHSSLQNEDMLLNKLTREMMVFGNRTSGKRASDSLGCQRSEEHTYQTPHVFIKSKRIVAPKAATRLHQPPVSTGLSSEALLIGNRGSSCWCACPRPPDKNLRRISPRILPKDARRESIDRSYTLDYIALYFLGGNLTDLLQGNTRTANVGQLRRTRSRTRPKLSTGVTFGLTQSMSPDARENLSSDQWLENWADGRRTAM